MKIKSLAGHIGEEIMVAVSGPDPGNPQRARLHLVDDHGLWLESRDLVESLLSPVGIAQPDQLIFLPFSQIQYITEVAEIEPATRLRFKW